MVIKVPRKGHKGYNKSDWVGVPGGITPVSASIASGGTVALSISSSSDLSAGAWTYTSTDVRASFAGSTMTFTASAGVYDVPVKAISGLMSTVQIVRITVT